MCDSPAPPTVVPPPSLSNVNRNTKRNKKSVGCVCSLYTFYSKTLMDCVIDYPQYTRPCRDGQQLHQPISFLELKRGVMAHYIGRPVLSGVYHLAIIPPPPSSASVIHGYNIINEKRNIYIFAAGIYITLDAKRI